MGKGKSSGGRSSGGGDVTSGFTQNQDKRGYHFGDYESKEWTVFRQGLSPKTGQERYQIRVVPQKDGTYRVSLWNNTYIDPTPLKTFNNQKDAFDYARSMVGTTPERRVSVSQYFSDAKRMTSKYDGVDVEGRPFKAGAQIYYKGGVTWLGD